MTPESLEVLGVASSAAVAATAVYSFGLALLRTGGRALHALSAATAAVSAVYGFAGALQYNLRPGPDFLLSERAQFVALLFLGPLLVALGRTLRGRTVRGRVLAAVAVSIVLAPLVLVTELIDTTSSVARVLLLQGLTYDVAPGPLAPVLVLHILACGLHGAYDFVLYAARKRTWLRWFIYGGTALFIGAGTHDALVKIGWLNTGYVFVFGVLGCAATIATAGLVSHLEAVEAVERSRNDLEAAVHARTQALRDAQSRLLQEHQLAALGRLSAGVAHEVNNPLAAIQANLMFLRETLAGGQLTPENEAALRESLEACQRTSLIVRDLSSLARRRRCSDARLALAAPVQTAARFLARSHPLAKSVELRLDQDAFVLGDETGLGQVAVNLLENALQAIEELPAGTGRVLVHVKRDNGSAVLSVEDNGHGIPSELRSQIFDPFFTTKDVGRGTGLGLAICSSIVSEHKGTIRAEQSETGGARMVVTLPGA